MYVYDGTTCDELSYTLVIITIVLQDGWSPLMIASQNGHYDIVLTLIGAGAEVNYTDKVFLIFIATSLLYCSLMDCSSFITICVHSYWCVMVMCILIVAYNLV